MATEIKISADQFGKVIQDALKETRELTEDAIIRSVDKTTRETVKAIKEASPVDTGVYKSGWTSKNTTKAGRGKYGKTVYNSKKPGLVHTLQHGHGGPCPAPAHPHLPTDEETAQLFEKNLKAELEK